MKNGEIIIKNVENELGSLNRAKIEMSQQYKDAIVMITDLQKKIELINMKSLEECNLHDKRTEEAIKVQLNEYIQGAKRQMNQVITEQHGLRLKLENYRQEINGASTGRMEIEQTKFDEKFKQLLENALEQFQTEYSQSKYRF